MSRRDRELIANISAAVAEEERRRLIKRVEAGVARAQDQEKWLGAVPVGFKRDAGEVGYLDVHRTLERVDNEELYRSVARDVPNLARATLMTIHKDNDRRQWYLDAEAADERRDAAFNPIEH